MDPSVPVPGIQRQRLADQVYDVLRSRILERQLLPGERLSVPKLAVELGLSRSPVREAVQRLVAEGLGVEQIHRGAAVASVEPAELDEMYEIRSLLEGLAARRAAVLVGTTLVADLDALLTEHAAAIDARSEPDIIRADLGFHARILEASGSDYLSHVLGPILGRANLAMLAGDLASWPKEAVEEHRAILNAITAGDQKAAERNARRHIEQVHRRLLGRLRKEGTPHDAVAEYR